MEQRNKTIGQEFLSEISSVQPSRRLHPATQRLCTLEPIMAFITDLKVPLSKDEEDNLRAEGYLSVPGNLNKGTSGKKIHLWYKRGSNNGITAIQSSFNNAMSDGLHSANYTKINKNLNDGCGGDEVYLWFKNRSTEFDVPIMQLHVTTEEKDDAEMFGLGWERLACDLNRKAGGKWIHLWVQREKPTYICDIKATADYKGDANNFNAGWNRVDEDTNRGAGGAAVFIWYRQTHDESKDIKNVDVSTSSEEYSDLDGKGYTKVTQDLNQKTGGNQVYLWHKKDDTSEPIKAISLLVNNQAKEEYRKAKVPIIEKNVNEGNSGDPMFLCYYK